MAVKAMPLVGLDVHAHQTHAAILDPVSGEVSVRRLPVAPVEVASCLVDLGPELLAVYEAGPTGFGLARAARERGLDVRMAAPGSIPRAAGDRVKTDRRDAVRLVRLLAAGQLAFAFVPSIADEQFRDPGARDRGRPRRSDARAPSALEVPVAPRRALPRARRAWTAAHLAWLRGLRFDDVCSHATWADYLAAVELLLTRRASLVASLEQQIPESRHAPVIARLRCFRGIETLSAAGLCADIGDFTRFARPNRLSGFLGIVPSEHTSGHQTPARVDHQGRAVARPPLARRGRPPLPPPARDRRRAGAPPSRPRPARDRDRLARAAPPMRSLDASAPTPRQARRRGRDRLRARTRRVPLGGRRP
jgi:transposase